MCVETCNLTLNNTGVERCPSIMDAMTGIFAVQTIADDGTPNVVDLAAFQANPATYVLGKVNQADGSKRWYPIQDIKNITDERAEATFQTFDDDTQIRIKEGIRSFSGEKPKVSAEWIRRVKGFLCAPQWSVFIITKSNQLVGTRVSGNTTEMFPIGIQRNTFNIDLRKTSQANNTTQAAIITWQYDLNERDENLVLIPADVVGTTKLASYNGLLDVLVSYSAITTTGFTATLSVKGSNIVANIPVTGLQLADFALFNITDSLAVTIASLTESSDGVYVFTFAAQSNADVLRLTPTKNGYDFSGVVASTILIP